MHDANGSGSGSASIGVAIIGMGFMGWTHARAYLGADAAGFGCRLVSLCDPSPIHMASIGAISGNLDGGGVSQVELLAATKTTSSIDDVLNDPHVDLVSICTHTDSHVDLAIRALEAGKHVVVEKPIALSSAKAMRLVDAVEHTDRLCVPAMCMRFWPAWAWLKEQVDKKTFGEVRSAAFRRLGTVPTWARAFYSDNKRTGGALFDLHIHDVDFVTWCFGESSSVTSTGSLSHISTLFRFDHGPAHVVAEGGWDHAPGFPFQMRYTVVFDDATADFDINRPDQLLLYREGSSSVVRVDAGTGYDGEVRHMLSLIGHRSDGERIEQRATIAEAVGVVRLLETMRFQLDA